MRNVIIVCCFAFTLFLASCANREKTVADENEVILQQGARYVCIGYERISWEKASERRLACDGDLVYSVENCFYYNHQSIKEAEIKDLVEDYDQFEVKVAIFCQTVEGTALSQERMVCEAEGYARSVAASRGGDILLALEDAKTYLGIKNAYSLVRIDSDGQVKFTTTLEAGCEPAILTVDGEDNTYALSQNKVYCFNRKGKCIRKTDCRGTVLDVSGDPKDGLYLVCMGIATGTEIIRIRGGKEAPVKKEQEGLYEFAQARTGQLLARNATKVYLYSEKNDAWQELLSFLDLDVNPGDIVKWWMGENEKIYLIVREDGTSDEYLVTAEQRAEDEIIQKEILKLGVWGTSDALTRVVAGFNRANEKYRVEIMDYSEKLSEYSADKETTSVTDRIKLDLFSGKGPDLLSIGVIDIGSITENGMMEDLGPYLEKSEGLSREVFFDELIKSATYDGILAYLPGSFWVQTMMGKTSVLGEKDAWTIEDLFLLMEKRPQALLLAPKALYKEENANQVIRVLLLLNQDQFFGNAEGSGMFDAKALIAILNKAKEVYDARSLSESEQQAAYRNDEVLLYEDIIYNFSDLTYARRWYFGKEPIQVIGYPVETGKAGHVIQPNSGLGIMTSSKHKEAAWSFLEYWMSHVSAENMMSFSSQRKIFEKQMSMAFDYAKEGSKDGAPNYFDKEDLELLQKLVQDSVGAYCSADKEILSLISEEVQAFYVGSKSAEAVADVIQSRVKLYINENAR